jgi:hypothetical protein
MIVFILANISIGIMGSIMLYRTKINSFIYKLGFLLPSLFSLFILWLMVSSKHLDSNVLLEIYSVLMLLNYGIISFYNIITKPECNTTSNSTNSTSTNNHDES